ncbi:MAG: hypothetical protein NZ750_11820 [Anaerolineae bacterium]|nr:hypothetical protein [Anaerolineae bacterium]MDW8173951.1 hypothetical protein [Anaerolineae bacterium]
MTAETKTSKRLYVAHDNGIHEFIFPDVSNETLDWWFAQLDQIYIKHANDGVVRFLYLSADLLPSISAVTTRVRAQNRRLPNRPATRVAVLYNNARTMVYLNVFSQIANTVGRDTTRFFNKDHRQEAIEWLLQS